MTAPALILALAAGALALPAPLPQQTAAPSFNPATLSPVPFSLIFPAPTPSLFGSAASVSAPSGVAIYTVPWELLGDVVDDNNSATPLTAATPTASSGSGSAAPTAPPSIFTFSSVQSGVTEVVSATFHPGSYVITTGISSIVGDTVQDIYTDVSSCSWSSALATTTYSPYFTSTSGSASASASATPTALTFQGYQAYCGDAFSLSAGGSSSTATASSVSTDYDVVVPATLSSNGLFYFYSPAIPTPTLTSTSAAASATSSSS